MRVADQLLLERLIAEQRAPDLDSKEKALIASKPADHLRRLPRARILVFEAADKKAWLMQARFAANSKPFGGL